MIRVDKALRLLDKARVGCWVNRRNELVIVLDMKHLSFKYLPVVDNMVRRKGVEPSLS